MNNEVNNRYFQWVAGERRGEIMVFDKAVSEGSDWYISFKDGSRINEEFVAPLNETNLTGKLMAEIDSPKNCWQFKEREGEKPQRRKDANSGVYYDIPTVEEIAHAELEGDKGIIKETGPKAKIIDLIPPRPTKNTSSFAITNVPPKQEKPVVISEVDRLQKLPEQPKPTEHSTDPVFILMSKAKKEDSDITMTMTISLPPKSLYDIAKESFEGGDKKFIEYIIENISVNEIKDALKVAITEMYENIEPKINA